MDTVWTTVKVRRSMLEEARAAGLGSSNAGIVQRALESVLNASASSGGGPPSGVIPGESGRGDGVGRRETREGDAPSVDRVDPSSAPSRASAEEAEGGPDARTASHRSALLARPIEGQTTVDEMLASCPNCAEELTRQDDLQGALACTSCGYVRESS